MTSNNAFTLYGATQPKLGGQSTANQTSTPQYAIRGPQTAIDAAYGNNPGVLGYGTSSIQGPSLGNVQGLIKPTTPVKKVTHPSGTTVEYHAPEKKDAPIQSPTTAPTPTPPPPQNTYETATKGLIETQTSPYNQSVQGSIGNLNKTAAGNIPLGQNAQNIAQKAGDEMARIGGAGARAEAGQLTTGTSPVAEGNAAITAQTVAAQQGAVAQGAQTALQGNAQALTGQQQAETAYNAAGGLGNTGQANVQGALGAAGNLTQPVANAPYFGSPENGGVVGGTGGAKDAIIGAGNLQTVGDFTQKYNQGQAQLKAADGIGDQIINTLKSNPTLNSMPITAITNLNEFLAGQTSDPSQQVLSQQIANYIGALGLDPASVANIAHQQKGTLAQLLDSLRQTAETKNEAFNPKNVNTGGTSGGSSGNHQVETNSDGTLKSVKF